MSIPSFNSFINSVEGAITNIKDQVKVAEKMLQTGSKEFNNLVQNTIKTLNESTILEKFNDALAPAKNQFKRLSNATIGKVLMEISDKITQLVDAINEKSSQNLQKD